MSDLSVGLDRGRPVGPSQPDPYRTQRSYIEFDLCKEDRARYEKIARAKDAKVERSWLADPAGICQADYRLTHEELDRIVPAAKPDDGEVGREKRCERCGLTRHLSLFYRSKTSPDGYTSTCRICESHVIDAMLDPDETCCGPFPAGVGPHQESPEATRDEDMPEDVPADCKRCARCKQIRPRKSDFYKHSHMRDGLSPSCIACERKRRNKSRHLCRLRRLEALARAKGNVEQS